MNGMHLQFQYTVKKDKDIYTKRSKNKVILLAKKLIDITRQVVVCDLRLIMEDEKYPVINIADIEKEKYNSEDFDDVNFDGYKDIRQFCPICSGAQNAYEDIYCFNPRTKKFQLWTALWGCGVEIDKLNKTVTSTINNGGREFSQQQFKFNDNGIEVYERKVNCTVADINKQTFKVVYDKYAGKKLVIHKIQIITDQQRDDIWALIDK